MVGALTLSLILGGCQGNETPVSDTITTTPAPVVSPTPSPTPDATLTPTPADSLSTDGITKTPAPTPGVTNKTISITADGFSPSSVTVTVGSKVTFVNNSDTPVWPASDVHPSHLLCPGFDSLKGLKKGESYTVTFDTAKVCPFHNHLKPSMKGTITIQ